MSELCPQKRCFNDLRKYTSQKLAKQEKFREKEKTLTGTETMRGYKFLSAK
jgi:hypothetical protein